MIIATLDSIQASLILSSLIAIIIYMIIATLNSIQASLILSSLIAIIQDLASFRTKNYGSFIVIVKTHLVCCAHEIQTETILR